MKSYFAKLADRATLANVPAPPAAHAPRVSDPFEETAPAQTSLPVPTNKPNVPVARAPLVPVVESQLVQSTKPKVETPSTDPVELPSEISTLQPRPRDDREVVERIQVKEQVVESPKAAQATPEEHVEPPNEHVEPPQLVPNQITEFNPQPKKATKEIKSKKDDVSLTDLQREQALSLRKADLFMSSLFEAQHESQSTPEREVAEQPAIQVARSEREPSKRLEPAPRAQPTVTAEPEGPSLIIGNLTVEVTSPSPTPAQAQPQHVIVRGSRGRAVGMRSSQRFGLGQF
jgi:hypothetical protein